MPNQKGNTPLLTSILLCFKQPVFCRFIVLMLFVSSPLANAGSWSNLVSVTEAYAHSSGNIFIQFTEMHNPDGCSSTSLISVQASNPSGDRIYSTLLNAVATGQKVLYYISGCDGSFPRLLHLRIRPPE